LEQLTLETYKDGTSLAAIQDGKLVGVAFNKMQKVALPGEPCFFDEFKEHQCKTETAKEYMYLMMRVSAS
jgi:hypothetical protein